MYHHLPILEFSKNIEDHKPKWLWEYMVDKQFPQFLVPDIIKNKMGIKYNYLPIFNSNLKLSIIKDIFNMMQKITPETIILDLTHHIQILKLF